MLLRPSSFHLVRNPELIQRLTTEIADPDIPEHGELTRKHIQQLRFLKCCLNESGLRPYPSMKHYLQPRF